MKAGGGQRGSGRKRGGWGTRTLDGLLEGGVEVVDDLVEAVGGVLVALVVDHEDLGGPFPHGELYHGRRLVAGRGQRCSRIVLSRRGSMVEALHDILLRDNLHLALLKLVRTTHVLYVVTRRQCL